MSVRQLCTRAAVLLTFGLAACGESDPQLLEEALPDAPPALATKEQSAVANKVLILSTSVFSGSSSQEATAARNLGMSVDVFLPSQWTALTAADFATYRAIILGDGKCLGLTAINAAIANKNIWGPMVNGNIIVVGASPTFSTGTLTSPGPMTKDAIAFAIAQPNKTGAYVSLSCYYSTPSTAPAIPPGIAAQVLDQFGSFTMLSPSGCYNTAHIAGTFLTTPTITDTNLSNWGCSAREVFATYPEANFAPLVIAKDNATGAPFPASRTMPDATHGPVYVIAKGAKPLNCGNGVVDATEQCDNGALNGTFGNACSLTCRLHWCGDGIQDSGEDCDLGSGNGNTGTCSASCLVISSNRPPVARCLPPQTLPTPANSCGVSLSINNGSFDPDDNLLSCTQSPAGPYGLGATTVTLTCRDTGGLTNSCTTSVTVYDNVAPQLTCPTIVPVECTAGAGHATLPPPTTAVDNCSAVTVTGPGERDLALGTTPVTYTATDRANNSSECTTDVVVADTLGPVVMPNGFGRIQLECGTDTYNEVGATANDQCYGDVSTTVTVSGSVDPSMRGSYMITYSATDPEGHVGEGYRDVVVQDLTPPDIELLGANPQPLECGIDSYNELGARAQDACSGDLTSFIHVDASGVDPNAVGPHSVRYWVSDANEWNNEKFRSVPVRDTTPPVITCPAPTGAECVGGTAVVDPGPARAVDACELASVSPNHPAGYPIGTTSVGYSATDRAGHTATCSTDVTVFDSLPPSVALLGDSAPVLECGVDPYVEAGATAVDVCYGDISSRVVRAGAVNPHAEGLYELDYSATDPGGNPSGHVKRDIRVKDTRAPGLHLEGANPMQLECGVDTYAEPGVSADDACYGDLSESITVTNSVNPAIEGGYTVNYSVVDPAQNAAISVRLVNVKDTRKPQITLLGPVPSDTIRIRCDRNAPAWVDPGATASDSCYGSLTAQIIKHGGVDTRNPGSYQVTYDVTDGAGLSDSKTRSVNVVMDPPQIVVRPSAELWPPNHTMQSFRLSDCAVVNVTCGPPLNLDQNGHITRIYSDEAEDARGGGDGATLQDIVITGPSSFQLRGERMGGSTGRAYGVDFDVWDNSRNVVGHGFCRFLVPHDGSGRPVIDEGPSAGYVVYPR